MTYPRSKYLPQTLLLFALLLISVAVFAADKKIEESFKVKPGGELQLESSSGSISVESWNKNEVDVQVEMRARRESQLEDFSVNVEQKGNKVLIEGDSGWGSRVKVKYKVKVPKQFNLNIKTGGGSIAAGKELEGNVLARTSGGGIKIGDVTGDVDVNTSGGSISVGKVSGELQVDTSGGSIKIAAGGKSTSADTSGGSINIGPSEGPVKADTSGGSIRVAHAKGDVHVDTSGGSIILDGSDGNVRADTAGGSIQIDNTAGTVVADTSGGSITITRSRGAIKADTSGGHISAELIEDDPAVDTSIELSTNGGKLTVYLPEKLKASISARLELGWHSREAQIYSDFPLSITKEDGMMVGEGDINGGGDRVVLKGSNEDIYIKKLP